MFAAQAAQSAETMLRTLPAQALQLVHGAALRAARATTAEEVEAAAAEALAVVASCLHDERSEALPDAGAHRKGAWQRMRWNERFDAAPPASGKSVTGSAASAKAKLLCAPRHAPLIESVAWHWRGGSHFGTAATNATSSSSSCSSDGVAAAASGAAAADHPSVYHGSLPMVNQNQSSAGVRVLAEWAHADAATEASVPAAGECRGGDTCRHKHVGLAAAELLLRLAVRTIPPAQLAEASRAALPAAGAPSVASTAVSDGLSAASEAALSSLAVDVLRRAAAQPTAATQASPPASSAAATPLDALRSRVAAAAAASGASTSSSAAPASGSKGYLEQLFQEHSAAVVDAANAAVEPTVVDTAGLPGASNSLAQSILASSILVPSSSAACAVGAINTAPTAAAGAGAGVGAPIGAAGASAPSTAAAASGASWRERMAAKVAASKKA